MSGVLWTSIEGAVVRLIEITMLLGLGIDHHLRGEEAMICTQMMNRECERDNTNIEGTGIILTSQLIIRLLS